MACRLQITFALLVLMFTTSAVHGQTRKVVIATPVLPINDGSTFAYDLLNSQQIYHIRVAFVINHARPPDIDLALRSGDHTRTVGLMSDVGSSSEPWVGRRIVFDDCARRTLKSSSPQDGAYRPTNVGHDDAATMAGGGVYDGSLSHLNGETGIILRLQDDTPNGVAGTWSMELTLFVLDGPPATPLNVTPCSKPDYDGDGLADVAVYRPAEGHWYVSESGSAGATRHIPWGAGASSGLDDIAVPADYDGDAITDLAVYRRATGEWFIRNSFTQQLRQISWGAPSSLGLGDTPVPADYDGDGIDDIAIYRESDGMWYILNSATSTMTSRLYGHPPSGDYPAR